MSMKAQRQVKSVDLNKQEGRKGGRKEGIGFFCGGDRT